MADEANETPDTSAAAPETSGAGAAPATSTESASAPPDLGADAEGSDDLFDFDAWDGKADSLPEPWRPVGQRYEQRLSELESAARARDEYKLLYDALVNGQEDPRIEEHTKALSERDGKLAELQAAHDKVKADYDALNAEILKAQEEYAREQWEAFKSANPVLARSEKGRAEVAAMIEEGFDFDQIALVANMPRKDAQAVRELVKSGTAPPLAVELIQLRQGSKRKAEDTSSAHLVAGSTTPQTNPTSMAEGRRGRRSYTEAADDAIARAFRRA